MLEDVNGIDDCSVSCGCCCIVKSINEEMCKKYGTSKYIDIYTATSLPIVDNKR